MKANQYKKKNEQNKIKLIEEDRTKENKINWTGVEYVRATHKIDRNKGQDS